MASMGYHKRIPRRKFNIRPYNKPPRVAWCQERLHWTYEEWKRLLWTDKSPSQQPGSVTEPGLYENQMSIVLIAQTRPSNRAVRVRWYGGAFAEPSNPIL